jgi:hypothetical protein
LHFSVDGTAKVNKKSDASIRSITDSEFASLHTNQKTAGQKPSFDEEIIVEEERPIYELSVQLAISPFNIIKRLESKSSPGILYR